MNEEKKAQDLDLIFDALANEHRREIIYSLSLHPSSISQLASMQGLSLPAIHKHIKMLEIAGIVIRKKTFFSEFGSEVFEASFRIIARISRIVKAQQICQCAPCEMSEREKIFRRRISGSTSLY